MRSSPADRALDADLRARIRDVPDFPIPGVGYRDITPVLSDPALFRRATEALAAPFATDGITHVAAIESRGFIVGAPVAQALGAAFVPIRKLGKLPYRTERIDYALEYGSATIEVHVDAWPAGARVLVVDDVLATGGTAAAACVLVERMGARVAAVAVLVVLGFMTGEVALAGRRIHALARY